MQVSQTNDAGTDATPARGSTSLVLLVVAALAVAVAVVNVWVPVVIGEYPWVTPDGEDYLRHARDLVGTGLVQLGYRQVGYPAILAVVETVSGVVSVDGLVATAHLQQALLLAASAVTVVILRWWSLPIVIVALSPPMGIYPNLILTESIGISLAMLGATAAVAAADRNRSHAWVIAAAFVATVLPVIRLHWVAVSGGICLALLWSLWSGPRRRLAIIAATVVLAVIGLFTIALAWENHAEEGIFRPSLSSERQVFWMVWTAVVPDHPDAVERELPEIYGGGSPDPFIRTLDSSGLDYRSRAARYEAATDEIFRVTGTTLTGQRIESMIGTMLGGRVDDLVLGTAEGFAQPLASPPLHPMVRVLVVGSIVAAVTGLFLPRARPFAAAALGILLVYVAVALVYPLDNLRFLLPGYLAVAVLAFGGIGRQVRVQPSAAAERTRSR